MTSINTRTILILAASPLSDSELRSFAKFIEKEGALEFVRIIQQLRNFHDTPWSSPSPLRRGFDDERLSEHQPLIDNIEKLLLSGAGLTKRQASNILFHEIEKEEGPSVYVPSPNKVAFRLWLARVFDQVAPSRILHIASRIRNEIVHGTKSVSDWPLIKDGDW